MPPEQRKKLERAGLETTVASCGCVLVGCDKAAVCEAHDWAERHRANVREEELQRARALAVAALRPATLAAELCTSKEEIVEAIARALLPFIEAQRR